MAEVNKKIEPEYPYQYTSPKQIGAEGEIGPVAPESGEPSLIRDELTPIPTGKSKFVKTPLIDAPELPIPTAKGIRIAAVKKAINDQAKTNPWIASPNYMGAFLSKYYDLLSLLRENRFIESQMKQQTEAKMFELGMFNADNALEQRQTAADKERVQAVGSFLKATVSGLQIVSLTKSRGEATREADTNKQFGKDAQQVYTDKITDLEGKKQKEPLATEMQTKTPQEQQEFKQQFEKHNAEIDQKIATEKSKLQELEKEYRKDVRENIRRLDTKSQTQADAMKQTIEGAVGIAASVYTVEEGRIEKDKARNEALIQMFNKLDDGINKAKDDLQAQTDKIIQQAIQTSSENVKAHQVSRG